MSVPPERVEAFDLGEGRDAALCLHGLTGTPYEVRPLGEALAARGLRAVGPWLPGHGGSAEALAATRHRAWIEEVGRRHEALARAHERVYLVGLSLGGLLALWRAGEAPVDALAVVGVPLRLRGRGARLIPWIKHVYPMLPKRNGSDIRAGAAQAAHPSLDVMPLAAAHELMRLQRRLRPRLSRVTAPILIAHGQLDRTASPDDARELAGRVASAERSLLWLPNSGHVVPVDHDGPQLAEAVADFLTRPRPALRYVAAQSDPVADGRG